MHHRSRGNKHRATAVEAEAAGAADEEALMRAIAAMCVASMECRRHACIRAKSCRGKDVPCAEIQQEAFARSLLDTPRPRRLLEVAVEIGEAQEEEVMNG